MNKSTMQTSRFGGHWFDVMHIGRLALLLALAPVVRPPPADAAPRRWVRGGRNASPPAPSASREHHYFRRPDGTRLHYLDAGRGPTTFVFVPGWMTPAEVFRPQLTTLSARHRVVVLDPRSQGLSPLAAAHPPGARADDIAALLEAAGVGRYILVGWSLGVMEVLDFAARHPHDGLEGLVLIDNSVGLGQPARGGSGSFARALRNPRRRKAALTGWVDALFHKPPPPALRRAVLASALAMPARVALEVVSLPYPRTYYRDTLLGLDVPLAYAVTPRLSEQLSELATLRPAARTELFADAGHALFVDEPDRFEALLEGVAADAAQRRREVSGAGPR
jgi:non-heme chloroperoxidase